MALANFFFFTKTVIDLDSFLVSTHNQYRVVSVRPYVDKKGELPDGYNLILNVLKDDFAYGVDKNGVPRETNLYHNFNVTVLNRNTPIKQGDIVRLREFIPEKSFVMGFDQLLRFKDYEVIPKSGAKTNA